MNYFKWANKIHNYKDEDGGVVGEMPEDMHGSSYFVKCKNDT